ncbi:hypothetical protein YC2023_115506 [Brassica napus]
MAGDQIMHAQPEVETNTNEIYAEVSLLPDTSDVSQLTPSQEIIAKDIHGHEWSFKHTLRGDHSIFHFKICEYLSLIYILFTKNQLGTPKRHLFTSGWNEFAKGKKLVAGDSFVFLRGENGESRVGISKAAHQQRNIPTSLISKQSMHHSVVATALNAIENKCMFVVFYKPRSSQFIVNFDKFVDRVNNKFNIGSKFSMKFEGKDLNEIRYNGTVVGVRDFSDHWKDSEWRSLEVQWDEAATIPRPDKVSPWEIELLTHSSNIFKSDTLKHKRQLEVHEFGSKMWVPTIYNERMVQAMKEPSTTTATTSCRLFGVDLMVPAITKDPVEPIVSNKKCKISKIFEDEKVDHVQAKSRTKLIDELERLFDIKGELHMHNQWKMFFIYNDGDMMILGDDPWPKFCNMVKEIFICSKEDVKIGIANNRFSEGDPALTTTILPPDVNNT